MVGGNNPRYFIPRLQAKVANPLLLLIRAGGGGLGGCFRLNRRGRVPRPPTLVAPFGEPPGELVRGRQPLACRNQGVSREPPTLETRPVLEGEMLSVFFFGFPRPLHKGEILSAFFPDFPVTRGPSAPCAWACWIHHSTFPVPFAPFSFFASTADLSSADMGCCCCRYYCYTTTAAAAAGVVL